MKERFEARLTTRTERPYIFSREVHECTFEDGFAFYDMDGMLWRPSRRKYDSDGASIPFPLAILPCFARYKYMYATMGIHDPACRFKELELFDMEACEWKVVAVARAKADELLRQGIVALDGWEITGGAYWLGVRVGAAGECIKGMFAESIDCERRSYSVSWQQEGRLEVAIA
jgi:hypothetical protein